MPVGIVVLRQDDQLRIKTVAKYPEEILVPDHTLMQVYAIHQGEGEAGMISFSMGAVNGVSYFTGPQTGFYVLILLTFDEDPDSYEEALIENSRAILSCRDQFKIAGILPQLFKNISLFPQMTPEQKLAAIYSEQINELIIRHLRTEGVILKSDLKEWVKEALDVELEDVDKTLSNLVRFEIIKTGSVKELPTDLVFFTRDVLIARVPPYNLIENLSQQGLSSPSGNNFSEVINAYFGSYQPKQENQQKLLKVILDFPTYVVLQVLRGAFVTREDLEKLKEKGVDDADAAIRGLSDADLLVILKNSQGKEYYGL